MEFTESQKKETEKRLKAVEHAYGAIPPVNQILSERPDMFIPNFDLGDSLFREKTVFDIKTKHLFALAAAAALSGEYCMKAQMAHAKDAGATDEEVLEVLEIASYMALTKSQSYSFREYAKQYEKHLDGA